MENIIFIGLDIMGTFDTFNNEKNIIEFKLSLEHMLKNNNVDKILVSLFSSDMKVSYIEEYTKELLNINSSNIKVANKCYGGNFYIDVYNDFNRSKEDCVIGKDNQFIEYISELSNDFNVVKSIFIDDYIRQIDKVKEQSSETITIHFSDFKNLIENLKNV